MRQSHFFTKTRKESVKGEPSLNADLLIRGGFVNKELAGVYSFLPLGLRVLRKIENIIRDEMTETLGAREVLMPALHPLQNYKATGRDNIDVLFHTKLNSGGDLVLGQSHEEIVVPLMKRFVSSYKDLPQGVFQIQTKFRNELRPKSGLLRGREFLMKDLYSFHADKACFEEFYDKATQAYHNIFARLGIGDRTYFTFAGGGSFSKYSHEFQALTKAGEDRIYLCENCEVALNEELIPEVSACPQCGRAKSELRTEKAVEVANIFPLGSGFSDPFGLTYKDEKGKERSIMMGCYGIGVSRVMGAIVEMFADEKGIVWPLPIAPYAVHLLSIGESAKERAEELYEELSRNGIEVLFDDRDNSPGEKFAECDLIGIPYRLVVSEKTLDKECVELKRRSAEEAEFINIKEITDHVKKIVDQ